MSVGAWDRFTSEYVQPISRGEEGALDLDLLRQLDSSERRRAGRRLLELLELNDDLRAADALGELMATVGLGALTQRLRLETDPERALRLAKAVWLIEGETGDDALLLEVAANDSYWGHRMRAVIELRKVVALEAEAVLLAALTDSVPLVRHHAALSLAVLSGRKSGAHDVVEAANALMSRDAVRRGEAIDRVRGWIGDG